ncbi:MAG: adenylate/guanylate cyclase domain-containing protein [Gemmatimonadota bacterium]|nr:adenylate/guanylate cyclase domain-containing protein [Gemmatimonadota bacterium]
MSLSDDLKNEVGAIFRGPWEVIPGRVVPDPEDVGFDNKGVELAGAVLYADIAESTVLVDTTLNTFAAEIYKTYLHCAGQLIREYDGVPTAYDGDRVMAVFIGDGKETRATRAALKINYACKEIVNAGLLKVYPKSEYMVKHVIGIATSKLLVARTGVRGANDLVWVGSAANHAAKLAALSSEKPIWITKPIYDILPSDIKQPSMWQAMTWNHMGGQTVYRTSWRITF